MVVIIFAKEKAAKITPTYTPVIKALDSPIIVLIEFRIISDIRRKI